MANKLSQSFRLNKQDRRVVSEKILDLGNIAIGALVFSQVLNGDNLGWLKAIIGTIVFVFAYTSAIIYLKGAKS